MSLDRLDVATNRARREYPWRELGGRILWGFATGVFRLTPRPCWALRRWILRLFGARIGPHVHVYPTARIFLPWNLSVGGYSAIGDGAIIYNLGMICVGERTTISQHAHLCAGTHDYRDASFPLVRTPITIGDDAWICADAFVGPGVSIGDRAILAARGVAVRDIEVGVIAGGNPARPIKIREPFRQRDA